MDDTGEEEGSTSLFSFHHSELCFFSVLFFQHKDAYQVILDGVKGGTKEKRLAAQFIPKFFKHFPELADSAINAQLDLCEDEDVSIRRQAIKELPQFATGENLPRVADILTQLLQTDDSAEFNLVNNALLSIFKMDAKGKATLFLNCSS
ncbi:PREDICTED: apoptosis inhibitor 5-like [Myotis davidii]|uniref:apoptosis inhibitor 5-like n=1 Tax=Myotis davidii TaxID=225400 RepID=UPI0007670CC0|nr:PREDICTED: apoptosis inhibitor 5-like [Myotis davidii]